MTDRLKGFIVHLDHPVRDDDAEPTIQAILQIKGVVKVEPLVDRIEDVMARAAAKREMGERLWKALKDY